MPQKTLIFALFAPPEMLRGGTLPFCPPLCTPLKSRMDPEPAIDPIVNLHARISPLSVLTGIQIFTV